MQDCLASHIHRELPAPRPPLTADTRVPNACLTASVSVRTMIFSKLMLIAVGAGVVNALPILTVPDAQEDRLVDLDSPTSNEATERDGTADLTPLPDHSWAARASVLTSAPINLLLDCTFRIHFLNPNIENQMSVLIEKITSQQDVFSIGTSCDSLKNAWPIVNQNGEVVGHGTRCPSADQSVDESMVTWITQVERVGACPNTCPVAASPEPAAHSIFPGFRFFQNGYNMLQGVQVHEGEMNEPVFSYTFANKKTMSVIGDAFQYSVPDQMTTPVYDPRCSAGETVSEITSAYSKSSLTSQVSSSSFGLTADNVMGLFSDLEFEIPGDKEGKKEKKYGWAKNINVGYQASNSHESQTNREQAKKSYSKTFLMNAKIRVYHAQYDALVPATFFGSLAGLGR